MLDFLIEIFTVHTIQSKSVITPNLPRSELTLDHSVGQWVNSTCDPLIHDP